MELTGGGFMKKAGMILEGGGQRGIFTSGVLDYLMRKKIVVPYVIGVSAGACNAVDYVSGQILRTKECMLDAQLDHELYGVRTMMKTCLLYTSPSPRDTR